MRNNWHSSWAGTVGADQAIAWSTASLTVIASSPLPSLRPDCSSWREPAALRRLPRPVKAACRRRRFVQTAYGEGGFGGLLTSAEYDDRTIDRAVALQGA